MKTDDKNSGLLEHQRRKLGRWLEEWKLAQILRSDTDAESVSASTEHVDSSVPPKTGQIRLMFPVRGEVKDDRPLYVVILEQRGAENFLIAPFGTFTEPALPGEWLTGLKAMPLRVLCLWNSREVSAHAMGKSWMAGRMDKGNIQQALEVCHHFHSGVPLISVSESRLGPPVRHPLDPRLRYQAEEAEIMDAHLIAERGTLYEIEPGELRLAAEPRAPYGGKSNRRKRNSKPKTV
jgi:hypothetical protein